MRLEKVAGELEQLRAAKGGLLKPEDVVEFAKDPNTALHAQFEWDDTEAARQYRLVQARTVIQLIVKVVGEPPVPMRAYVSLPSDRVAGNGYRSLEDVVNDESRMQELVRDALERLQATQRRYAQLKTLLPIWAAIDAAVEQQTAKAAG